MSAADPYQLAIAFSWTATGIGVGLWIWSWVRVKDPIGRLRFQDCGVVLVFGAVLARIGMRQQEMSALDWVMLLLGPLFIAAALWRLSRTQSSKR